jgi:hypothetical protein
VCLLLLFRARAALVVLMAGGSEAATTRFFFFCSSWPGQHWLCSWLVGWRQRRRGVFLLLFRARTALVVLLAGALEVAATRCLSSALQGQDSTGCAPGDVSPSGCGANGGPVAWRWTCQVLALTVAAAGPAADHRAGCKVRELPCGQGHHQPVSHGLSHAESMLTVPGVR